MNNKKYTWRYADTKELVTEKNECFFLIPKEFQEQYGFGIYSAAYTEAGCFGRIRRLYDLIIEWNKEAIPAILKSLCKKENCFISKEQWGELLLFYYGINTKSPLAELGKCLAHYNTMLPYPIKITAKPTSYEKMPASEFVEVTEQESEKENFLYGAYICFPDAEGKAVFKYEEIPISEYDPYGLKTFGQYMISSICSTAYFTDTYLNVPLQIGKNSYAFYSESEDACIAWLKSEHTKLLEKCKVGYEILKNVVIAKNK